MLGITSPQYGHMVVCDGYGYNSSTLYHHLNMGWAGTSDAWYNLPNIDAAYTFDTVSTVVYNIYTTGSGEIIAGRVTDGSGNPISGATVNATLGASSYSDTTDGYGIYGIGKVPSGTQFTVSAAAPGYSFASRTVTTGISQDATNTSGNQAGIDFQATLTSPPSFPVDGTPVAASATAITWKWVDVSGETGYRVRDTAGVMKSGDLAADLVQWTEGSLQPNTSYTRRIHSFNASGESAGSSGQSRYTLARAGQSTDGTGATGNVYCTTAATNTWYGGSKLFTFSNPAGFGANGAWMASSFQYKWNTQAAEGWSSAGAGWTAGTISLTPTSGEGDYYLHVRALNAEGAANNLDVLNYGPFRVDCTAPSALSVSDEGAYTPALDSLSASWTASSDAKSGLDHYEYAIGTSASLQNIRQWSSTGASTSVTASPVGLTEGVTYYLQARAVDKVGNVSPGSAADGILTAPGVATIPQAWAKQNGVEPLSLRDKMVTYTSAGEFCMQETDKPFAIRVVSPANPAIGSTISIAGVLGVQGTQRVLIGGVYKQPNGSTGNTPARVVSMIGRNLGGCNFNPTTPGVPGSMGPYNLGTLARICGRVTYTNTSNASMKYFCVDDGSGLSSATRAGVRIYTGTADPPRRGYASVSGVIMSESIGGVTVPVLMIRDSSDINSF